MMFNVISTKTFQITLKILSKLWLQQVKRHNAHFVYVTVLIHSTTLCLSSESNNDRNPEPDCWGRLITIIRAANHTQTDSTHKLSVTCLPASPSNNAVSDDSGVILDMKDTWESGRQCVYVCVCVKMMVDFWPHWSIIKVKVRENSKKGNCIDS